MTAKRKKTAPATAATEPNAIQVIGRAAEILRAIRNEPSGLSLGQIAERVDLAKSTVQRIVNALGHEGFLILGSGNASIRLGPELQSFADAARVDVAELAHPHLKALSKETGETVDLAMLRRDHLIFIDQVVGSHRLRTVSAVGERFPLHCTANGKATLALMSDADIRKLLPRSLERFTPETEQSLEDLLKQLKSIRRAGIAYDRQEHSEGISALGSAFVEPTGAIYSISIPMPNLRFLQGTQEIASRLLAATAAIARDIGGRALAADD